MPNPLRDPTQRASILKGTLGFGIAGATIGGFWSLARGRSFGPYTLSLAFNCGLVGFTFLATRRFVLEERLDRGRALGQTTPQLRDADMIAASTVAGGAAGSIWSGVFYGSQRVIAGFLMFGLLAGGVQMCATAANHMRQQIILNKLDPEQARNLPLIHMKHSLASQWSELTGWIGESLAWIPIHKLSATEHRELLEKRLALVDMELNELELTIADAKPTRD
ncbi:hypothetical protein BDF22DRAFT_696179 [Syncephalis plumigaleata]|nr:hypothetical protein BDF22DRAFT_696179 [Syncephalis plumigaleata]